MTCYLQLVLITGFNNQFFNTSFLRYLTPSVRQETAFVTAGGGFGVISSLWPSCVMYLKNASQANLRIKLKNASLVLKRIKIGLLVFKPKASLRILFLYLLGCDQEKFLSSLHQVYENLQRFFCLNIWSLYLKTHLVNHWTLMVKTYLIKAISFAIL